MKIRLHLDNRMCVGSELHHVDTVVIEVSFLMWLKAFFFGLDLCATSLMFPKLKPDESVSDDLSDEVPEIKVIPEHVPPVSLKSENIKESSVSVSQKQARPCKGRTKKKQDKTPVMNDAAVFGVQMDDNTIVFPDGRTETLTSSSVHKVADKTENTPSKSDEDIKDKNTSTQSKSVDVQTQTQVKDKVEIDFKNPPHSPRWKPRNLPPRPVRKPRQENV